MILNTSIVIIGAGPSGLSAFIELFKRGMTDVFIVEREACIGGILNQCIHNGFGLKYYHEDLTGPQFIEKLNQEINSLHINKKRIFTSTMVLKVVKNDKNIFEITGISKEFGLIKITADIVITATGCRERTRENIEIPGTRPAGIFTAGQAQALINKYHYEIGKKVIIQGSGDIGLIMARRLAIEGFSVLGVFEKLPYLSGSIRNKIQCLDHFNIPLYLGWQISEIKGKSRVSSAVIEKVNSKNKLMSNIDLDKKIIDCDTILFAVGLIPELETIKFAGVTLSDNFHPNVNSCFETNIDGLFVAGNCLHINDLADSAAMEGKQAAAFALEYINDRLSFDMRKKENLPYKEQLKNTEHTQEYFNCVKASNQIICIICPKGCFLTNKKYGCLKGKEYFEKLKKDGNKYKQRVSTTVEIFDKKNMCLKIKPFISKEEIPIEKIPQIITEIKKTGNYYE